MEYITFILQGVTQVFLTACEALEVTKGKKSILLKDSLGLGIYKEVYDLTKKSLQELHQLFSSECNSQNKQTMTKKTLNHTPDPTIWIFICVT